MSSYYTGLVLNLNELRKNDFLADFTIVNGITEYKVIIEILFNNINIF